MDVQVGNREINKCPIRHDERRSNSRVHAVL